MATVQTWRNAYGALKGRTRFGLAHVNFDFKDLDVAVFKPTNHVDCLPKERHLRTIAMTILCCSPLNKPRILASDPPSKSAPSQNSHQNINYTNSTSKNPIPHKIQLKKHEELQEDRKKLKRGNQPSVLEFERAIGSGIFRDSDGDSGGRSRLFEKVLGNTVGKSEGSVEKKLREAGEWLVDQTEGNYRSAGKQILMAMFVWLIPMWIVAFLLVSGAIQIPLITPFLEDVIS